MDKQLDNKLHNGTRFLGVYWHADFPSQQLYHYWPRVIRIYPYHHAICHIYVHGHWHLTDLQWCDL
ncbi:hypothetical protein NW754_015955 [Fusarium falciforme]|nr:hypothetical protein NW754_015955 [Fusarium falciforme]KAJ4248848.1 hypothetical protein NW757_007962 [Fusarium falciforme]